MLYTRAWPPLFWVPRGVDLRIRPGGDIYKETLKDAFLIDSGPTVRTIPVATLHTRDYANLDQSANTTIVGPTVSSGDSHQLLPRYLHVSVGDPGGN